MFRCYEVPELSRLAGNLVCANSGATSQSLDILD